MDNIKIGDTLRALRKSRHFTQQYIAKHLSISRQAYSNYETNKRTPDLTTLKIIARLYQVTVDQIIDNNPDAIFESPGIYFSGIEISKGETVYLTPEEKDLILKYRALTPESRAVLEGYLLSQMTLNEVSGKDHVL